jgi:hypothetical protein
MAVALLALFMALSGTTYAVTKLPKRSVGSAELKKGAVRSENIAKGAVTISKLSKTLVASGVSAKASKSSWRADASYAAKAGYADSAGRADTAGLADRATLADKATSATTATSATSAGTAGNADTLDGKDSTAFLPTSAELGVPRFNLPDAGGNTKVIYRQGPFTFTARCFINNSLGQDLSEIDISTTQAHSAFQGFDRVADMPAGGGAEIVGVQPPTGTPDFEASAQGTAIAPDGTEIRSIVLYAGVNLNGQTGKCTFGGLIMP